LVTFFLHTWMTILIGLLCAIFSANAADEPLQLEIVITGISGELKANALAALSLARQQHHPRLSLRRMRILFDQGPAEIRSALKPFGYYHAEVLSNLQTKPCNKSQTNAQTCDAEVWEAHFTVTPGEPVLWDQIEIKINGQAQNDPVFQALLQNFPLQSGKPLRHAAYEQVKQKLSRLAEERGYFRARYTTHQILLWPEQNRADARLYFDSGPRFEFGETTFEQQPAERFAPQLLAYYIRYQPGDAYNSDILLEMNNSLIDSEYFAEATVSPAYQKDQETLRVPIQVKLKANKPNHYRAGIGYGTDTGLRTSANWDRRYVNRYGHRFSMGARAAAGGDGDPDNHEVNAQASYFIPVGDPKQRYLAFNAGYQDKRSQEREHHLALLGAQYHRTRKWQEQAWQEILGLEYRYERFAIGQKPAQETSLFMPSVEWTQIIADNRMSPRHGHKLGLSLRAAVKDVGSDMSFLQSRINAHLIRSRGRHRVGIRGDLGYTWVEDDFSHLPESQRFFTGGDRSVRGYDYQSLGERDADGQIIGGEYLLTASIEYEYRLWEKWGVAVFYDTGNAFSDWQDYRLHQGVGLGLRWHSPIGPVSVDVASAISEPGQPLHLHINIGPEF